MHTHFALVLNGRVLGFRDNIDSSSLDAAERTAAVFGPGTEIYEIKGPFPRDPHACLPAVEAAIKGAEPVSRIEPEADSSELEDTDSAFDDAFPIEKTGVFLSLAPAPGQSGTFESVAAG